jgi:hypothetical protein
MMGSHRAAHALVFALLFALAPASIFVVAAPTALKCSACHAVAVSLKRSQIDL